MMWYVALTKREKLSALKCYELIYVILTGGNKMYFYRKMYCDEKLQSRKKRVLRKLRMNVGQLSVYTISLAYGKDLFDIMHCANFKQKGYDRKNLYIIGIASSYEDAAILVQHMIHDFYKMYATYDFKGKLLENDKDWY